MTVVAPDRLGLFADTAGLLATHGLTVRSALVRTVDGLAVDTWWVDAPYGEPPPAPTLLLGLQRLAAGDTSVLDRLVRRDAAARSQAAPARSVAAQIAGDARAVLVTGASERATVAEVRAPDRPGLLHGLGRALADSRGRRPVGPRRHPRRTGGRHALPGRARRLGAVAGPGRARRSGALLEACEAPSDPAAVGATPA